MNRQNPEDDYINEEPHKISLCWNQPQLLIHLVEQCQNLNNLNLTGKQPTYYLPKNIQLSNVFGKKY